MKVALPSLALIANLMFSAYGLLDLTVTIAPCSHQVVFDTDTWIWIAPLLRNPVKLARAYCLQQQTNTIRRDKFFLGPNQYWKSQPDPLVPARALWRQCMRSQTGYCLRLGAVEDFHSGIFSI